jgi:DNA primase
MIHADDVQRVRDSADAIAIIGGYVKLRRSGRTHRGPCPFHNGKGPNFSVASQYFRCFVCGKQGDTFTFLQEHLGLDFVDAVRHVAETLGITLRSTFEAGPRDSREPLWEANEAALQLFEHELWFGSGEPEATKYLADRGITIDEANRFELGWAPRSTIGWRGKLGTLGHDDARLLNAGLLVDRNGDGKLKGRFWERVMFPVRDIRGRLAGFGGRRIDGGEPKYLNSPDSPTFNKSELLYNLHNAKSAIRLAGRILIVEGYMDVIRVVLAGVSEVVAPMGTALTPQQAKLIRRFSSLAILIYDNDKAGIKAAFRTGDALLAEGVTVRVATLPDGHDPDSFVRVYGRAALDEELTAAIDVFERKIEILTVAGYFDNVAKKHEAFDRLAPTINAAADPLTKGLYVARAAEALGVAEETVRHAVAARRPR